MFANIKLGMKVAMGMVVMALVLIGVGVYANIQMTKADDSATILYEDNAVPLQNIGSISNGLYRYQVAIRDLMMVKEDQKKEVIDRMALRIKDIDGGLAELEKNTSLDEVRMALFANLKKLLSEYLPLIEQVKELANAGKNDQAQSLLLSTKVQDYRDKLNVDIQKYFDVSVNRAKKRSADNTAAAVATKFNLMLTIIFSVLFSLFISYILYANINSIIKSLIDEAERLSKAAVDGALNTRGEAEKINFEFRGIVVGVNRTLDAVIGPLNVAADYVDKISKGNIPAKITDKYNGDFNTIKNNLNQCVDAVNILTADASMLVQAAIDGKLETRADANKHSGDYKKIVDGVNKTLDAVIGPLNVAADYVDKISKGNIPAKITDKYNGDFNTIKNNLNQCIDAVNALTSDANILVQAAVDGKLETRADANKHSGDYKKIVDGVNKTLDSVIGPLNVAADYVDKISKGNIPPKITDKYNGDFNTIKNNLNQCIDSVNMLVADAVMLSEAAVDGRLATRADAEKHSGDFKKIVVGVNKTLDAVIGPLNVAADYVEKISKGNIPAKITDKYNGDFNTLKNNLNQCIDAVNLLVSAKTPCRVKVGVPLTQ